MRTWRPDLEPGAVIPGPAIVAEDETSTLVTRRLTVRVTANRYLVIARRWGDDAVTRPAAGASSDRSRPPVGAVAAPRIDTEGSAFPGSEGILPAWAVGP